jgi:hypothetical protein
MGLVPGIVDAVASGQHKDLFANADRQLTLQYEAALFTWIDGSVLSPGTRAKNYAMRLDILAERMRRQKLYSDAGCAFEFLALMGSDDAGLDGVVLEEIPHLYAQCIGNACEPGKRRHRHTPLDL